MSEETDRIVGLELGAADYVGKPCNPRELLARVRAVLRRQDVSQSGVPGTVVTFAGWRLDRVRREITKPSGEEVILSRSEFIMLEMLVENAGRIVRREQLLEHARAGGRDVNERAMDVQISRLRRKLNEEDAKELIVTVRGEGYLGVRPPTVLLQVALLAVVAVIATQAVTLAFVALSPEPKPAGYTLAAAAEALRGVSAKSSDGRRIQSRRLDHAPFVQERDPLAQAIARSLATELHRPLSDVRVQMDFPRRLLERRRPRPPEPRGGQPGDPYGGPAGGPQADQGGRPGPGRWNEGIRIGVLSNQINFPPFSAAVRQDDGQWTVISPPKGWLAPWQKALLASMVLSLILLAPLIWWMAQRLAHPIRSFAQAADRLGADPDAAPLTPNGPNEVRLAISAFNDMQAKLREHIERRTQTVAAIAHDLRTPLTRLRFRIEAMPEEQQAKAIADIEEMDALVAQAMQFVKGQFEVRNAEVLDFGELVQGLAVRYADTGADIRITTAPGLMIHGDAGVLRRGLTNLLDNAIVHGGSVVVSVSSDQANAVARIQDQGPGIPADQLERVFDPFFRLEGSRSRETGGAGLGLSIARHAVRAHGGDLTLSNIQPTGLQATLSVPLA
ncbi:hypothetical protein LTR94_024439 [Friedmanniomyces endolithicus]|nr:hypothetical protein LTR94_024439 [Friedmanniomyces endolithicus]